MKSSLVMVLYGMKSVITTRIDSAAGKRTAMNYRNRIRCTVFKGVLYAVR